MEKAINELNELINSIKNDWSKWGDISEYVRTHTLNKLKRIRREVKRHQKFNKGENQ